MLCAAVLKGRKVHPRVELGIAPGSRQVLKMLADNGSLGDLVAAGARILECGCGPCIGQGFSPGNDRLSLRTFNRNFAGRSGTKGDKTYLVSPEVAVAAALTGEITDPRKLDMKYPQIQQVDKFLIDDGMITPPLSPDESARVEIIRGPTIVKPPAGEPLPEKIDGDTVIKVGEKITTDHIMPAGTLLKLRSNVPEYAKHVFAPLNEPDKPTFAERAMSVKQAGRCGVIIAGDSYGQGSSREHAALCPMYLGVRVVIAKTIERIHQANLVNFAILPLSFEQAGDYDRIDAGDQLIIEDVAGVVGSGQTVTVRNATKDFKFTCRVNLSPRQREILAAGGLLNYTRQANG
jgi:aconitate hydratase